MARSIIHKARTLTSGHSLAQSEKIRLDALFKLESKIGTRASITGLDFVTNEQNIVFPAQILHSLQITTGRDASSENILIHTSKREFPNKMRRELPSKALDRLNNKGGYLVSINPESFFQNIQFAILEQLPACRSVRTDLGNVLAEICRAVSIRQVDDIQKGLLLSAMVLESGMVAKVIPW